MVDRHVVFVKQLVAILQILIGTDAGDFKRRIKNTIGDLASHYVYFITTGDCNNHIGIFSAGTF